MNLKSTCLALIFLFSLAVHATDEPRTTPSDLKTVTVYRSGAELTHNASASLQQGNTELIIEGLSNSVDINSIQINCPAAVTILSSEFGTNFLVLPEVSSRIRSLQDSMAVLQKETDKINVQITTTTDLLDVLKLNREIKGQQTGLSVAELVKLMDYYKLKSTELQNDLANLKEKKKKYTDIITKIQNQVRDEESKNTRNRGQLKLQLSVASAGKYDFVISYITPSAFWTPYYDVRVDDIKSPLRLIYKAKISQFTGIDWKKVKMSLSTSLPSQWGNAPVLSAWFLAYINPVQVMNKDLMYNTIPSIEKALQGKAAGVSGIPGSASNIRIRGTTSVNANNTPLYVVNGAVMSAEDYGKINPSSIKSIDILKDPGAQAMYGARGAAGVVVVTLKDGLEDYISVTDNELNISFDIDLPYDVPTNGKEQTATLKEFSVAANYKYYSVPKLDRDAYLLAEVSDWEKLNLLPGEANVIFEGTYVGKSFIDPASTSDTLNLTLGRDKRIVVKKEKMVDYSSVKFLGSNKLQKMTWEITVKNNKKEAVNMILKDQYPLSTNKDIEVELLEDGAATMNNKDIGVLTWMLNLAPGETKKVRVSYSVKYPKDKALNLN